MIRDRNIAADASINPSKIMGGGVWYPASETYYVSRNVGASGDGLSLRTAFKTIGEAVAKVNADYTAGTSNANNKGRLRRIVVSEGWYSEIPLTLTANDVHIVGVAPGNHDSIVLYGSATAGGYDITSGGPALTLQGSNCTIENMGFFTYDALYPSLSIGAASVSVYGNKILNCSFVRDVADGSIGGIADYGADGSVVEGCFFSTSCKDYGIKLLSNGVINPVNARYINNLFIGTPIGIHQTAGHNTYIAFNTFLDDSSDRADTIDNPCYVDGSSAYMYKNFAPMNTLAEFNGGAAGVELANICSDSAAANYPA